MNTTESIPQVWDVERDTQFFRLTADVFPRQFCAGASVLLASYDADDDLDRRSQRAPAAIKQAPAPSAAPAQPTSAR